MSTCTSRPVEDKLQCLLLSLSLLCTVQRMPHCKMIPQNLNCMGFSYEGQPPIYDFTIRTLLLEYNIASYPEEQSPQPHRHATLRPTSLQCMYCRFFIFISRQNSSQIYCYPDTFPNSSCHKYILYYTVEQLFLFPVYTSLYPMSLCQLFPTHIIFKFVVFMILLQCWKQTVTIC